MARQITITIETDSVLVLRGRRFLRVWCPQCGSESEMIPLNEVGVISNWPSPEVEAWIQSQDLHHSKAANGKHLVCLNSMLNRARQAKSSS